MPDARTEPAEALGPILKKCPKCGAGFRLHDLLHSASVEPIGMAVTPVASGRGFYYFNHRCPGCGTTFLVPVEVFASEMGEDVPAARLTGGPRCKRHCTRLDDTEECEAPCHNAPYRRFLVRVLAQQRG